MAGLGGGGGGVYMQVVYTSELYMYSYILYM